MNFGVDASVGFPVLPVLGMLLIGVVVYLIASARKPGAGLPAADGDAPKRTYLWHLVQVWKRREDQAKYRKLEEATDAAMIDVMPPDPVPAPKAK